MEPLKPCPFCGETHSVEVERIEEGCWSIGCVDCDFTLNSGTKFPLGWHTSKEEAIKAWNTRKG